MNGINLGRIKNNRKKRKTNDTHHTNGSVKSKEAFLFEVVVRNLLSFIALKSVSDNVMSQQFILTFLMIGFPAVVLSINKNALYLRAALHWFTNKNGIS